MAEALYSIDILRLAAATARWPMPAHADGRAERRSPTCGSRVAIAVTLDDGGAIAAVGLDVGACALGQASAALMAAGATGREGDELAATAAALGDWLAGRRETPPDWPGLEALAGARAYPARHPSILLAFQAAADAVDRALGREQRAHG